jgi:hypothetical protein
MPLTLISRWALGGAALCVASYVSAVAPMERAGGMGNLKPKTQLKAEPVTTIPDKLVKRRLCVWDIMGQNGDMVALMKDYQVKAATLGVDFDVKGYVDEKVASEDFRVGYCDAVVLTGLRVRPYNAFTGSIEAVGAIPSYAHMKTLIDVLSAPTTARYMTTEKDGQSYEVAGILPFGSAYGFVNDRVIQGPEQLPGKKIAIFDYDKAQAKLVRDFGARSDPSDVTNFSAKFNNGQVDIVISPVTAYRPLELYRGLGKKGGIIDYVLAQVSIQVVIHPDRFPTGFGQSSRNYMKTLYDRQMRMITQYEGDVDPKYWIRVSAANTHRYDDMSRTARMALVQDGIYEPRMMALLRRIRCQIDASRAECSQTGE